MSSPGPCVLDTNDDGVASPGLHALLEAMHEQGEVSPSQTHIDKDATSNGQRRGGGGSPLPATD